MLYKAAYTFPICFLFPLPGYTVERRRTLILACLDALTCKTYWQDAYVNKGWWHRGWELCIIYLQIISCSTWNRNSLCATPIVCKHRPCAAAVGRYVICFQSKTVARLLNAKTWAVEIVNSTVLASQVSHSGHLHVIGRATVLDWNMRRNDRPPRRKGDVCIRSAWHIASFCSKCYIYIYIYIYIFILS